MKSYLNHPEKSSPPVHDPLVCGLGDDRYEPCPGCQVRREQERRQQRHEQRQKQDRRERFLSVPAARRLLAKAGLRSRDIDASDIDDIRAAIVALIADDIARMAIAATEGGQ